MPGECWNCGRWLSGGDLLEGYCWDCKREVRSKDGGYPADRTDDGYWVKEDGDDE